VKLAPRSIISASIRRARLSRCRRLDRRLRDVLLARGAPRVYAVDVGRGQLHARLREDKRRHRSKRPISARSIRRSLDVAGLRTIDVSFISLKLVLAGARPAAAQACASDRADQAAVRSGAEAREERHRARSGGARGGVRGHRPLHSARVEVAASFRRRSKAARAIANSCSGRGVTERLTISRLGHRGDGIADTPDGPLYVPTRCRRDGGGRAVPGHPDRRHLLRVESASPERIAPICPHFGVCGGCQTQHWDFARYRDWKRGSCRGAPAGGSTRRSAI
jgi:hypothetical protein